MGGRLSLGPVLRAHWKGLSNDTADGRTVPDWWSRAWLILPSFVILFWGIIDSWTLPAPAPLLSALALLSGGILAVFAQMLTLRSKLTERSDLSNLAVMKDGIDEAVSHLLIALLICILTSATIVVGLNVSTVAPDDTLARPWSAFALSATWYLLVLFLILIPKLYSSYTNINEVRDELNGFYRAAPRRRSRQNR